LKKIQGFTPKPARTLSLHAEADADGKEPSRRKQMKNGEWNKRICWALKRAGGIGSKSLEHALIVIKIL